MSETNVTIYEDREFMIFNVSELNIVDFTKVEETSIDIVRKSVDQRNDHQRRSIHISRNIKYTGYTWMDRS